MLTGFVIFKCFPQIALKSYSSCEDLLFIFCARLGTTTPLQSKSVYTSKVLSIYNTAHNVLSVREKIDEKFTATSKTCLLIRMIGAGRTLEFDCTINLPSQQSHQTQYYRSDIVSTKRVHSIVGSLELSLQYYTTSIIQ